MAFEQPELLRDKHGRSIQIFGPHHGDTVSASIIDGVAVTLAIPAGTVYYELAASIPCYVNANGVATSSSAVFPTGVATYKVVPGQTQVSMMRIGADTGPVSLTPLG